MRPFDEDFCCVVQNRTQDLWLFLQRIGQRAEGTQRRRMTKGVWFGTGNEPTAGTLFFEKKKHFYSSLLATVPSAKSKKVIFCAMRDKKS